MRAQLAGVGGRLEVEHHRVGSAVVVVVADVAAALLQVAFPRAFLQQLAAHLERVAALAGVEEVGRRAGVLLAIAIELPDLVRAFRDRAAGVVPEEVGASCW